MIEVYLPDDADGEGKLANQIRPHGWEHLSGPFSWCTPQSQQILEGEHGLELPVRVKDNTMGTLAKHIHEKGQPNHSNFLFIGPPGNGKSAIEKFLAWTYLSETLEPVTYTLEDGEEVTLVDHQTGEPFEINPTNKGTITYDFVLRKLSESVLPKDVDPSSRVQLHNAGASDMNKGSVSRLADDLKRDLSMIGRRVVVISEIHDFNSKTQTRPLKTELDPQNMPDGLLVMADANSRAEARKALGEAGFGRFREVGASRWHVDTLRFHAEEYFDHFGIEFDEGFERDPSVIAAERAGGSIRELLFLVQELRDADPPVSPEAVDQLFSRRVEDEGQQIGQDVFQFMNSVSGGGYDTAAFVQNLMKRQVDVHRFLRNLCQQVIEQRQDVLVERETQSILAQLREACHYGYHEGPPTQSVIWASITEPLDALADRLGGPNP